MANANHTKSQNKSCCCYSCCKGNPGSTDVINNCGGGKGDNADDAAHIASIKNRSQSGTSFSEGNGSKKKTKKKNKKNVTSQENTTLMIGDQQITKKKKVKPPKNRNCKKCCLSFTAFLFSTVGLCCLVVGYSIMGGFLFHWLEADSETQVRADIKKTRDTHVQWLWEMTKNLNILHEGNWSSNADDIMKAFQDEVYKAVKELGWDGREEHASELQWSFPGSLLYSVTVITTIGYGHIAPKTEMGRLATIFYALVGIPLTLLFLANIGSFFGNCFRFLYKHLCIALVWLCCPNHFRQHSSSSCSSSSSRKSVNNRKGKEAVVTSSPTARVDRKGKSQDPSIFNESDTVETLQWKSSSPSVSALDIEKGQTAAVGFSDIPPVEISDTKNPYYDTARHHHDDIQVEISDGHLGESQQQQHHPHQKKKKLTLKEEVRVPMFVSLLIIALYIFGGACLFSMWEKDWDYLIGSYFCFITLSTVGFGDYVFGTGGDWDDNGKLIICCLYLVFGLSIIAMSFDLMQEEVRAKFVWLGTKLGLIDKKKEKS